MSSENWYFTADTNAKGYTYIKAYQTEWDPVRKRSRSISTADMLAVCTRTGTLRRALGS